jgi:site-specific DNA-methyltransferase (adenine-specific)
MPNNNEIICGDAIKALASLPSDSVDLVVTSPPYFGHRDYGVKGQIGIESRLDAYLKKIRAALVQLLRVSKGPGSCFIVIGDTYRNKRLLLVPHRIALLAADVGWIVRNDVIWHKLDPPPESPHNRWRSGHEHILFLTKQPSGYRFEADAIRVPYAASTIKRWGNGQSYGGPKSQGRRNGNDSRMRHGKSFVLHPKGCVPTDVWSMPSGDSSVSHYATFPDRLITPIMEACSQVGDLVLDPFVGTGTTCRVAVELKRRAIGIELNPEYARIARAAIKEATLSQPVPES